MSKTPAYEYELLHQFEVIFRDGEHKTQAATRDYSKVWKNVIDNPPEDGVTPIHVYRMNGTTCAVIAGVDEPVENEECAMEIARLVAAMQRERKCRNQLVQAIIGTVESCNCAMPKPSDIDEIEDAIADDPDNVDGYCENCLICAVALAAAKEIE